MRYLAAAILVYVTAEAADAPGPRTREEQARYLATAKIVLTKELSKGVTNSKRITLNDGSFVHDAHLQTVDVSMIEFKSDRTNELNFRDCWMFNVAASRLAERLGIADMVPVSVPRRVNGHPASVTWWVDRVAMDETARQRRHLQPPDVERWNAQLHVLRVFDQLIHNMDRNLGNLLIDEDWNVHMIDHTRAFRLSPAPREIRNIVRCDRSLLERMKALDEGTLMADLGEFVRCDEVRALLARRDRIVQAIEQAGERALYDRVPGLMAQR